MFLLPLLASFAFERSLLRTFCLLSISRQLKWRKLRHLSLVDGFKVRHANFTLSIQIFVWMNILLEIFHSFAGPKNAHLLNYA